MRADHPLFCLAALLLAAVAAPRANGFQALSPAASGALAAPSLAKTAAPCPPTPSRRAAAMTAFAAAAGTASSEERSGRGSSSSSRRRFMGSFAAAGLSAAGGGGLWATAPPPAAAGGGGLFGLVSASDTPFGPVPKTPAKIPDFLSGFGLRCYDYAEGTGATPEYGQVLVMDWVGFVRPEAGAELVRFDSTLGRSPLLFKHGNGRLVRGLDEGIHSMKVGGTRRIAMPSKLGYTEVGVYGPVPPAASDRRRLKKLLAQLDESATINGGAGAGELVFDVRLREAFDDDADRGYYGDASYTAEQMATVDARIEAMSALAGGKK